MKTADFDFELPPERIALRPACGRDDSRLLVLHRDGTIEHKFFRDIADYIEGGDMLVLNDTRVLPVRLIGSKPSGGKVDIILVSEVSTGIWEVLCRGRYEGRVNLRGGISAELFSNNPDVTGAGKRFLRFTETGSHISEILEICGSMPLPPYIKRTPDEEDMERYQTVYAAKEGSIAAPTAGLHFTEGLMDKLSAKGVLLRKITLHVGQGTFKPITAERLAEHEMLAEYFEVPAALSEEMRAVKAAGRRVITVGTTATRALEGLLSGRYRALKSAAPGIIAGHTDIFIHPGYKFMAADALLTNFHLPRSTPLMLASAFSSFNIIMAAYSQAIAGGYRFFSYGDAMLML